MNHIRNGDFPSTDFTNKFSLPIRNEKFLDQWSKLYIRFDVLPKFKTWTDSNVHILHLQLESEIIANKAVVFENEPLLIAPGTPQLQMF